MTQPKSQRATARTWRLIAALTLLGAALSMPAAPAAAAGEPGLERPASGERISTDGPYDVVAYIDATTGEEVRSMEARLMSGGTQVGPIQTLQFSEVVQTGPGVRRTRWTTRLDPTKSWDEGYPLRNGAYTMQVRAHLAVHNVQRDPTQWRGIDFVLDVDPPATKVKVEVLDAASRKVEVAWDPVFVPDFKRYVVQRKVGSGQWADYREVKDVDKTRWADAVPADGEYSYRVQTFRAAAGGKSERKSPWSAAASTVVKKPAPPPPPPGVAGSAGEGSGAAPPPAVRVRSAPVPRQPTFSGPDTYEEQLDYSEAELPLASGPEEFDDEELAEGEGQLRIDDESFPLRQALVPVATGLVLTITAWHVRRFLRIPD